MAFEDLKDQLRDQFAELRSKIEESQIYNTLRERYETLSVTTQMWIKIGTALVVVSVLVYFPYIYFSDSFKNVEIYNDKRTLIRKLLRAGSSVAGSVENPPPTSQLIENIRSQLSGHSLLPEQIGEINVLSPDALGGRFAPKEIEQEAIGVGLKKLNLKQVIEIGYRLQNNAPGVRLVGIEVRAGSPDPHYFDVLYKLARFSLPIAEEAASGPADRSNRSRKARAEEDEE